MQRWRISYGEMLLSHPARFILNADLFISGKKTGHFSSITLAHKSYLSIKQNYSFLSYSHVDTTCLIGSILLKNKCRY